MRKLEPKRVGNVIQDQRADTLKVGLGDWRPGTPTALPIPRPSPPAGSLPSEVLRLLGPRAQVSLGRLGVRLETLSRPEIVSRERP